VKSLVRLSLRHLQNYSFPFLLPRHARFRHEIQCPPKKSSATIYEIDKISIPSEFKSSHALQPVCSYFWCRVSNKYGSKIGNRISFIKISLDQHVLRNYFFYFIQELLEGTISTLIRINTKKSKGDWTNRLD